ncbi:MAG: peptidylprolyl isomerase [Planctomycetota bacterium]
MAKHKAATQITIAQEERSAFATFVDRYKWHGAVVLVVIAGAILWSQRSTNMAVETNRADWQKLYDARGADDVVAALSQAAADIERPDIAAWARVGQAMALVDDRAYGNAAQALGQTTEFGSSLLTRVTFPIGPDGAEQTLLEHVQGRIESEKVWAEKNPYILENRKLPDGSPEVELQTSLGTIRLGLYVEEAPGHVKNFIARVEEGYYDGTRFHRIQPGGFIQGGDPNSREDDPTSWGMGGPDETVEPEDTGLIHTAGVLAAAKKGGDKNSSGSQFYITASPQHQFDSNYVVYGVVLEGLEIVEEISNGEIREDKPETPVELITIGKATLVDA